MRYVERGGGFGLICVVVRSPGREPFRVMSNMEKKKGTNMRYVE
jgi:hypothetical protein